MALLSLAVTICNASLTFTNSPFCPHGVFMCFVWISEQTAIISLYSINWLVCTAETKCVYCAVRTGSLNKNQVTQVFNCLGCQLPASHRGGPISIQGQSMWNLWWTKLYLDGFAPGTSNFPRQYHCINVPFKSALACCCYQASKRAKPGNLPESKALRKSESAGYKRTPSFCWSVVGSVPQSVPCTQRRPAHHWPFTRQTVDTSTQRQFQFWRLHWTPQHEPRVSHFLTSCTEIRFVSIVPKIIQISTLGILISNKGKQTRLLTTQLLGRRTESGLPVGRQLPAAILQPSHTRPGALRYTSSVFVWLNLIQRLVLFFELCPHYQSLLRSSAYKCWGN